MRATRLISASGSSALLLLLIASAAAAQGKRERAPVVRITSESGAYVSNYVEPSIRVSEDAYVFAVAIDLDRQIQVLHPEFPGISVKIRSRQQLRLRNFFAGFTQRMDIDAGARNATYGLSRYGDYDPGTSDTRGTVIAIASREPFNLDLITVGGDWNIAALRRLIEHRDPSSAAAALARYLGATGEPIGRDFMRFAGRPSYYASGLSTCDAYYGAYGYSPSYAVLRSFAFARAAQLSENGQGVSFLGYDVCGQPIFALHNTVVQQRPPATGAFPKGRKPAGVPRNPTRPDTLGKGAAIEEGFRRGHPGSPDAGRMGDVTITAPTRQRVDPRQIPEQYRGRPAMPSMPERTRNPAEAKPAPRGETVSQGVRSVPEHRPSPAKETPAPSRAPERTREAPAPVIRERPVETARPLPSPRESKPEPVPPPTR